MLVEIILIIGCGILASVVYCLIINYRRSKRILGFYTRTFVRFIKREYRPTKPKREAPW